MIAPETTGNASLNCCLIVFSLFCQFYS